MTYAMLRQRVQTLMFYRSCRALHSSKHKFSDTSKNSDSENIGDVTAPDADSHDSVSRGGPKLTGFAQAYARHAQVDVGELSADKRASTPLTDDVPFSEVFRHSSHVHVGAVHNQIVFGKIFHTVQDDLYIDFGGKFHCVCKRPDENAEKYHRGARVRLRLKELELTDHFVGASRDLTLLEADAELLGLAKRK